MQLTTRREPGTTEKEMKKETEAKVRRLIVNLAITESDDPKIEKIADEFPSEYSNEEEYVEFQIEIADIVEAFDEMKTQTARQVTFMGITTTIDPLKDRAEREEKLKKGLITPLAFYMGLRASWAIMTDDEKALEYDLIS